MRESEHRELRKVAYSAKSAKSRREARRLAQPDRERHKEIYEKLQNKLLTPVEQWHNLTTAR